jgi:hypothetical protein
MKLEFLVRKKEEEEEGEEGEEKQEEVTSTTSVVCYSKCLIAMSLCTRKMENFLLSSAQLNLLSRSLLGLLYMKRRYDPRETKVPHRIFCPGHDYLAGISSFLLANTASTLFGFGTLMYFKSAALGLRGNC